MESTIQLSKEQIRTLLLYHFKSQHNATKAHDLICKAFGKTTVSRKTCYNFYKRFMDGDFSLQDEPRPGRDSTIDDEVLLQLIEDDPKLTTRELAQQLGCCHTTIVNHLHAVGKVNKIGKWLPHELTVAQKMCRVNICNSLITRHRTFNWINSIVTGDEKWVLHYNVTRKRSWVNKGEPAAATHKGPTMHKVMLCIWWDVRGVIMMELLPLNVTVTKELYCEQLDRLNIKVKELRPEITIVRFLHDNAPAHRAKMTSEKLANLGWEVLPHPPYSPDLAPTDYYLFRALQNHIANIQFKDNDQLKIELEAFFREKPQSFYAAGIESLQKKWRDVIDIDGDYLQD